MLPPDASPRPPSGGGRPPLLYWRWPSEDNMALLVTAIVTVVLVAAPARCCGTGAAEVQHLVALDTCPGQFQKVGNYCYHFNLSYSLQWQDSRQLCQSLGGDLAVIHTCDTLGDIVRHIHMTGQEVPPGGSYWIGGTDQGDEGAWYYVDGLPMSMGVPFWGEVNGVYEPSGGQEQNCASLYRDDRYYIHDGECLQTGYPLCQYGVTNRLYDNGRPMR